jgi:PEGA domain
LDFEVLEEVRVNGDLVVAKGGTAMGTVTQAEAKKRMARGGKLDITIDYVRLVDGEKAALRAVKDTKGGGHTGAMTAGIVATSLVVWPAAPFFLFMHGKDITIPKDTEITAYVNGDMPLDVARFQSGGAGLSPSAPPALGQDQKLAAQLEISSTPAGADIEIDGNFVGSTPSTNRRQSGSACDRGEENRLYCLEENYDRVEWPCQHQCRVRAAGKVSRDLLHQVGR